MLEHNRFKRENVYQNHLYCTRLDGTGLTLLDPGNANHRSTLSPSKKYLVDNCSRVDMVPVSVLRDAQGNEIMKLEESDMSTKVVAKVSAEEKMGLLVDVDEQTQIIEYSDMPEEIAAKTDDEGNLCLWAGNTAIHAFRVEFLREIAESAAGLPFHIAHKKVPYLNGEGKRVEPAEPNACKFERFIFDALPLAKNALVLEASRSEEFNPVKNAEGSDSPATSKAALIANAKRMLTAAGAEVAESAEVELSPLYALRAEQLKTRLPSGQTFDGPVVLK